MQFIRDNHMQLRVDQYRGLMDLQSCNLTCNLAWPEITNNLRPNQSWHDSLHLVTRVFRQYLQNIVLDLWENGILGRSLAMIHVMEFQK